MKNGHLGPLGAKSRSERQDELKSGAAKEKKDRLSCPMYHRGTDVLGEGIGVPASQQGYLSMGKSLRCHVSGFAYPKGMRVVSRRFDV